MATKTYETEAKWTIKAANPDGTDRTESRKGSYVFPNTVADFVAWLGTLQTVAADDAGAPSLSDDGRIGIPTLNYVFDSLLYGFDLKCKARLRPSVSAETPWISRDGIKINLATGERIAKDGKALKSVPLGKCINAVNNHFAEQSDLELEPKGNFVTARRMLLEAKKAREVNGKMVEVTR